MISRVPPQQMRLWTPWLFAASLLLLALVLVIGWEKRFFRRAGLTPAKESV